MSDDRVRDGIRDLETIKHKIMDLAEANPAIFQEYERLIEDYNASIVALKHDMRSMPFDGKTVDFGGGFRLQKRTRKGFDVQKLRTVCEDILLEPGVVKAVDVKAVREAAAKSEYAIFDIESAFFEQNDTPAAYGPAELKIEL